MSPEGQVERSRHALENSSGHWQGGDVCLSWGGAGVQSGGAAREAVISMSAVATTRKADSGTTLGMPKLMEVINSNSKASTISTCEPTLSLAYPHLEGRDIMTSHVQFQKPGNGSVNAFMYEAAGIWSSNIMAIPAMH